MRATRPGAGGSGLASPALARQIRFGAIFEVSDAAIEFPEARIAGAGKRALHPLRRCVVAQTRLWGASKRPPTLLVVPCSASQKAVSPWDLRLTDDLDAFSATDVVAFTSLVQPILKSDLAKHLGELDPRTLLLFKTKLAQVLDLAEIPDDDVEDAIES